VYLVSDDGGKNEDQESRDLALSNPQHGATLAQKLDRLFDVIRRENGEPHSHEEVASACRKSSGESFSATYLWQLRTGRRDNPTKRHLEALADFFQVPLTYFFDEKIGAEIDAELEFLGALRNAGVRNLALRALGLSPGGLATITDMLEVVANREAKDS
jgi:transcriptional regulator with XRE-family HTH domain